MTLVVDCQINFVPSQRPQSCSARQIEPTLQCNFSFLQWTVYWDICWTPKHVFEHRLCPKIEKSLKNCFASLLSFPYFDKVSARSWARRWDRIDVNLVSGRTSWTTFKAHWHNVPTSSSSSREMSGFNLRKKFVGQCWKTQEHVSYPWRMHRRAWVSLSCSRHMIILDRFNGMSSTPFACIIFSPLTSWSMMNPTSRHNKSSNNPLLPLNSWAEVFSWIDTESSSVLLLLFRAIMEPPKRLWFCAFDFIIVPIASSVSTLSFGSTVMVAVKENFIR